MNDATPRPPSRRTGSRRGGGHRRGRLRRLASTVQRTDPHRQPHHDLDPAAGRGAHRLRCAGRARADRHRARGLRIRPAVRDPDRGRSGRHAGPRRVRSSQDRLRQDARLRRADARSHHRHRRAAQAARTGARADPRARRAGRRGARADRHPRRHAGRARSTAGPAATARSTTSHAASSWSSPRRCA